VRSSARSSSRSSRPTWPTPWLAERAALGPHGIALVAGGARLSFGDLSARVDLLARRLAARGVRPGDRVATFLEPSGRAVEIVHAVQRLGATLVPLNPRLAAPEVDRLVSFVRPALVIGDDDAIDALKRFEGGREALATIYLTGPAQRLSGAVPLVKIATSPPAIQLSQLSEDFIACSPDTPQDEVAALFDKYNLITLAVVDADGRLVGIITADDVITMLRHRD